MLVFTQAHGICRAPFCVCRPFFSLDRFIGRRWLRALAPAELLELRDKAKQKQTTLCEKKTRGCREKDRRKNTKRHPLRKRQARTTAYNAQYTNLDILFFCFREKDTCKRQEDRLEKKTCIYVFSPHRQAIASSIINYFCCLVFLLLLILSQRSSKCMHYY